MSARGEGVGSTVLYQVVIADGYNVLRGWGVAFGVGASSEFSDTGSVFYGHNVFGESGGMVPESSHLVSWPESNTADNHTSAWCLLNLVTGD